MNPKYVPALQLGKERKNLRGNRSFTVSEERPGIVFVKGIVEDYGLNTKNWY